LNEPNTGGKYPSGKFEGTILIPKTADFAALKDAVLKVAQLNWPDLNLTSLGQIKLPFKDGDIKEGIDGYEGTLYLVCKSGYKPALVGPDRRDYVGPVKAGDFVRFSVTAGAFKLNLEREAGMALKSAGKTVVDGRDENGRPQLWRPAVTFYLNAVQWLREGPAFGGGSGGVEAFGAPEAETATGGDDLFR
jgi:hypothetical protein